MKRLAVLTGVWAVALAAVTVSARDRVPQPEGQQGASARPLRTGTEIYREACVTCHGEDGRGAPRAVVGFDAPLPDFTDCAFASAEPDPDWFAVVHEGGPVRGLDRHMPAFGAALSAGEIALAIGHVRTFCANRSWPRGDLNLPRAFFTEKAFPENEAVWQTAFAGGSAKAVGNELIYERRLGARSQVEALVPIDFLQDEDGRWQQGLGDVALAFKHTWYASVDRGRIAAAGAEVVLPTGDAARGLGNGFTVLEPFVMWGQLLPRDAFLQMHAGLELPSDRTKGDREAFVRTAAGVTFAQDRGFGRAWTPQVEVLWARPEGGEAEWDLVPQIQITLSKLQHVMVAVGVRVPMTQRHERAAQGLVYVLWDWYDGGFFEFWK